MLLVNRLAAFAALVALSALPVFSEPVDVAYRHDLADFTGTIPTSDARVVVDAPRSEVYTAYGNEVRVFNDAGMEIYRFRVDADVGRVSDLAIEESGSLLMILYAPDDPARRTWSLRRFDFRGRPLEEVALDRSGALSELLPNRLLLRRGTIWLMSQGQMRAAAFSSDGSIRVDLDLASKAGLAPEDRGNAEVSGFDVGADGTVAFAVPVQFRVHAIDPDGAVRSFGRAGSAAGNFGVLGDVALDPEGNLYVSDRLRSLVMIFNRDFRFLREFGTVSRRQRLARPGSLALDPAGFLYVSQVRDRGVAVFAIASAP